MLPSSLQVTHGQDWRVFDTSGRGLCGVVMGLSSVILDRRNALVGSAVHRGVCRGTVLSMGSTTEDAAQAMKVIALFLLVFLIAAGAYAVLMHSMLPFTIMLAIILLFVVSYIAIGFWRITFRG